MMMMTMNREKSSHLYVNLQKKSEQQKEKK